MRDFSLSMFPLLEFTKVFIPPIASLASPSAFEIKSSVFFMVFSASTVW